jgi:hypothetical protein
LIGYPGLVGGLGWQVAIGFLPDLSLTVLAIAGLAAATGIARAVRLVQARTHRDDDIADTETRPSEPMTIDDDRVPVTTRQTP